MIIFTFALVKNIFFIYTFILYFYSVKEINLI